ncbi:hypothetical protein DFH07DRAFT_837149 [Mycena maculata]|uniref:3-beta hydroxysteroid dehydrogenase/isomerase domain-containing protein n=1 Tax=Mycena maculata TaxID=230809 RepID=A0AAD7IHY1_9AGAR|nr:hypothetical protein DFH07DRAFT_837149 [Mycena maculata]
MTESRSNLVVVTGGTGYVGVMVIDQLLKEGYSVRATARSAKVKTLQDTYLDAGANLEVVEMADLVSDAGKWPEILNGVDAIIHIAGPVYHPGTTSEEIYNAAIGGTQKLLNALEGSSVKRFVLTSSIAAFFKPDFSNIMDTAVYDHNTWSEIDDIDPKEHVPSYTYVAFFPPTLFGWFVENYPVPKNVAELNGNKFVYELIQKGVSFPTWPITTIAHNRDVAKAHVLSLTAPVLPKGEKKRLIVSLGTMTWVEAIEFLKEPETIAKFKERGQDIVARLPDVSAAGMQSQYSLDTTLTENVLGLNKADYIPWKEILLEVVPNLIDWEKAHPETL